MHQQEVAQYFLCVSDGNGLAGESRVGEKGVQGAFEITNVGADSLGDQESHVVVQVDTTLLCLVQQDGHPGFEIRWFDGNGEAPAET